MIFIFSYILSSNMSQTNNFKKVSKNILLKHKFNTFLNKNSDISLAIDRIFSFIQKYRITVFKTLDDYHYNRRQTKRVFWVTFLRLLTLLNCLRYLFSALIPQKWVIILMSDANHLLGNQKAISFMMSIAALVILFMGAITQFKEMTHSCELWQFMYDFKHKRIIPLNDKHSKRITLIMNLMAKYLMEQAFWPLIITCLGTLFDTSVVAYFD